jgi:hypothetical protein
MYKQGIKAFTPPPLHRHFRNWLIFTMLVINNIPKTGAEKKRGQPKIGHPLFN